MRCEVKRKAEAEKPVRGTDQAQIARSRLDDLRIGAEQRDPPPRPPYRQRGYIQRPVQDPRPLRRNQRPAGGYHPLELLPDPDQRPKGRLRRRDADPRTKGWIPR